VDASCRSWSGAGVAAVNPGCCSIDMVMVARAARATGAWRACDSGLVPGSASWSIPTFSGGRPAQKARRIREVNERTRARRAGHEDNKKDLVGPLCRLLGQAPCLAPLRSEQHLSEALATTDREESDPLALACHAQTNGWLRRWVPWICRTPSRRPFSTRLSAGGAQEA